MGPNEPYWQTNTSFSPPISRRWEYRFHPEGLPLGPNDGGQVYESSHSSNSKGSRSWVRGDHLPSHQQSASEGDGSYFSSPSDSFQMQKWTPAPMHGVDVNEYLPTTIKEPSSGPFLSALSGEGTSGVHYSGGSSSSRSDNSEYEPASRLRVPSHHRNISSRCSFMSKPVHPLSFSYQTPEREGHCLVGSGNADGQLLLTQTGSFNREIHSTSAILDTGSLHKEGLRWSSASSVEFADFSEQIDSMSSTSLHAVPEALRCGLCEKFLSQRSPWSSRRIIRSGDMPVTGVLSCRHVFHAECLEQTTPKTQKLDPPCPLCTKSEDDNLPERRTVSRLKNEFPRLRAFGEEGSSRSWSCGQAGDCVEGALHSQARNSMMLLNRGRFRKQLSMKGNWGKDFDKLKKSGSYSLQIAQSRGSAADGTRTTSGPLLKRW